MFSFVIHQPILLYAFQVVACSAIFWLFYKGVIEPGRHFALSRWFLLFALMAPAVIPLLSIPVYPAPSLMAQEPVAYPAAFSTGILAEASLQPKVNPLTLSICIYFAICAILAVKLGVQLFSLLKINRSGSKTKKGACLIVHSPKVETPFSFARTIYLPKALKAVEGELFFLHEQAHIKNRHSLDILFYETFSIFLWFNPIFRLIGRELKKVHEYQADRAVVSTSQNARAYKQLIAKEFLGFAPSITNAFHGSLTKKRIIMLTQPFKTNRAIMRIALIIPLTVLNLMLFSCTTKQSDPLPIHETEMDTPTTKSIDQEENGVIDFMIAGTKPLFEGKDVNAFSKWVGERIIYPEIAKEQMIDGRVMLTFIIDTDGTLTNIDVLRSANPALDKEAVRVVSLSPKWTPGRHEGEIVKVRYNFPVIFSLRDNDTPKAPPVESVQPPKVSSKAAGEAINFMLAETKPLFEGGDENAFASWVGEQIVYPEIAKEKNIQGRVMLSFIIDTDGFLKEITVLRGVDPALDKESIRVLSSSPRWTPGMNRGQPVAVRYNFPMVFQLK